MESTGVDCNTAYGTIPDRKRRVESLNSDFGPKQHRCAYHLDVPGTKSQNSLERTSKDESYSVTNSNNSLETVSKIVRLATDVNICANERFSVPQTNPPRAFHCGKNHIGNKATTGQACGSRMEIVENTMPKYPTGKYLEKGDLLVKNIQDYDRPCIYSTSKTEHLLQTRHSSLSTTTSDTSSQIGDSNSQTSNSNLYTGTSSSQTDVFGLEGGNSRLHAGNNWTISGPCKHGHPSSRKPNSDDGLSCRICHSVTDLETLVSPCFCTGSMKYVHESCLLNWLKSSDKTMCELCLHEVPVKKLVKPFREWRFLDEKPVPIIWLLSFLILFTLNILSVIKDASRGCTSTTCIVFYVLGCSGAILGIIFLWFWARKSAVYFRKLLILNQDWLLDENYCKTDNKERTLNYV